MRWLVSVKQDEDQAVVRSLIESAGGTCDEGESPTPLGDDELVLHGSGPIELPQKLQDKSPICGVYPSSEMELY